MNLLRLAPQRTGSSLLQEKGGRKKRVASEGDKKTRKFTDFPRTWGRAQARCWEEIGIGKDERGPFGGGNRHVDRS